MNRDDQQIAGWRKWRFGFGSGEDNRARRTGAAGRVLVQARILRLRLLGTVGSAMMMLKPRLATLNTSRVKTLSTRIGATERTRGSKWMKIRARWLSNHPLCVGCIAKGYTRPATQLDHITPLWSGGRDDESNYQSLCDECHKDKTAEEAKMRGR